MRRQRILTWHVHGSYLFYLAQTAHEYILPVKPGRPDGYFGRTPSYDWPPNIREVPAEFVKDLSIDCVLYQSKQNYLKDAEILSEDQRRLPQIYLEHDPPRGSPTDTRHVVQDPNVLLVHVTSFNELMWDAGPTPTLVIEHGVTVPSGVRYGGEEEKGITVVNNIVQRGRRLGWDVFERVRNEVPVDLVGMGWQEAGGLGEVPHAQLPEFEASYRFFFNPIRYTSLGLSVCEAMMLGMPIVGLATTELVTVIENGVCGYLDTNWRNLIPAMKNLLEDRELARRLGQRAREVAQDRFSIFRFIEDWDRALRWATGAAGRTRVYLPQIGAAT